MSRVHILYEKEVEPDYLRGLDLKNDYKLVFYKLGRFIHYSDFLNYTSKYLLNKTAMYINSNCYLDKGFENIKPEHLRRNKVVYALSRHETADRAKRCNTTDKCADRCIGSHDAYIFHLAEPFPNKVIENTDYLPILSGIEQVLFFNLCKFGNFTIKNPCKIIYIVHNHCSVYRDHKKRFPNDIRMDYKLGLRKSELVDEDWKVKAPFSGL